MQPQMRCGVRTARAGRLAPLWTGSAPAVTFARQPIRAGRGDAQPISVHNTPGSSVFASALAESSGGGGEADGPHRHPRTSHPARPICGSRPAASRKTLWLRKA